MLQSINIENYAIIDSLRIDFDKGLSIITGETGSGKSILLGALALALGQRADASVIKNQTKNCVIEIVFSLDEKTHKTLFDNNDADFDSTTIFRRVINASGKSRAFINDIPVTLAQLKNIGEHLVDIHSQHQNLLLSSNEFQMTVVDTVAKNKNIVAAYKQTFDEYKIVEKQLAELLSQAADAKNEYDYLSFQNEQLSAAKLEDGEQESLENELKELSHAEEIKTTYANVSAILAGDETSVNTMIRECVNALRKISDITKTAEDLCNRIESCAIELRDITNETERAEESVNVDSNRQQFVENRLDTIYDLQQKHRVANIAELIKIHENIKQKLDAIENFDAQVESLQYKKNEALKSLRECAKKLTESRKKVFGNIEKHVVQMLKILGIPHAQLIIQHNETENYTTNGCDNISFLFSANKEIAPQEISKVASGGEISRLMLSLKSLVIESGMFPTIIFDEIDTGISGDIADKTGEIIAKLAQNSQIINITHLPQIASKGEAHYIVYKENKNNGTATNIRKLNSEERVVEIAKLLSGSKLTQAAVENAKELLKINNTKNK